MSRQVAKMLRDYALKRGLRFKELKRRWRVLPAAARPVLRAKMQEYLEAP